jgi:hypothetical protein
MPKEAIWATFDMLMLIIGIIIIVTILVLDLLFCKMYEGGFCVVRWTFTSICGFMYDTAWWPPTKLFIGGICKMVELIPI